ncbi:arginine deiminase [Micromonospora echinofusca]|uniref:Arginine deiminase n=1 Tax=Micromonospora echinofusca TaxID=47858 RepID=A0A1C5GHY0_MICEH|nr:arginine deiminase [Micromonospora echinofusca]
MNAIFIHPCFIGCRQTLPYAARVTHYVDSEVGRLGTVLLHRPGPELARLTPRNNDSLLFDAIPWVGRAQEEHDAFAAALRERGVEVLYLATLLAETLAVADARAELTEQVLGSPRLGDSLRARVAEHLAYLDPVALADVLIAGLAHEELRVSRERPGGLVYSLMDRHDFVIDPLPNLLFTRDSSFWVGDRVGVTSLAMPARRRETTLTDAIYRYHPRFAGTELVYQPGLEHLEGGDVLLLAPGVLAVGVGERTTPAGAERLARQVFAAGLAHTILVVPIAQERATMHLDTVCTMVDVDAVLMYPNIAHTLSAYTVIAGADGADPRVDGPAPFLRAAADAMDLPQLRVIDTGLDPVTAEREQWDDGNNTLAIAPRLCVGYERNTETNAQLERAGIEVIPIASSELGSGRGGPRCMSCPLVREPLGGAKTPPASRP